MNISIWLRAAFLIFLGIMSIQDLKTRQIQMVWILMAGIPGIIERLCTPFYAEEFVMSLVPGIVCIMLALLQKGIGMGDALVILAAGLLLGTGRNLICICCSSLAGAMLAVIMLVKGKGRSYELPFVPCILVGFIVEELTHV